MIFKFVTSIGAAALVLAAAAAANGGSGALQNTARTGSLPVAPAWTGGRYRLIDLGTLGGSSSDAAGINAGGFIVGSANLARNQTEHAALWRDGGRTLDDLGTLGGPNSDVAWPNHSDTDAVAGIAETSAIDPLGEAWSCSAFFPTVTHHVCLGFVRRHGVLRALPTLGGFNGYASGINNSRQVVGWAENTTHDPTCNPPQVLQFKPALWDAAGRVHQLPTFGHDPDGAATAINDNGQVVGISGRCDVAVGRFSALHAVLWQRGAAVDLGSLGGVAWNTPTDINLLGEIVGFSDLPGDGNGQLNAHAFLWTKDGRPRMKDLGTLGGDVISLANGINDRGQIVGVSIGATSRAFIWQNGKMTDLNALIPHDSSLHLISGNGIDDRGDIVGQALNPKTGATPAFLAIPTRE
ncbi:MAG: hypothetical protein M3R44_01260 [Candidatus Eremiobacteraeota bacterium]|nr:hypothetical protein [Candidatus Eremiobacteraeota bacterium]